MQTRTGFVVESLADGKKVTIGMRSNVSLLSEISIYTLSGEVKLFEVFALIAKKENNGEAISHKSSNEELEAYFASILPNYDAARVYISDIKKVVAWYNILNKKGLKFKFEEEKKEIAKKETPKKDDKEENKEAKSKKTTAKKNAEKSDEKKADKPKKTTKTVKK